jgi:hypothetical protein
MRAFELALAFKPTIALRAPRAKDIWCAGTGSFMLGEKGEHGEAK